MFKMKKLMFLGLASLLSCTKITPRGTIESRDIPVAAFRNLNLKGHFRVFYISSSKDFVNVETYPNIYENLRIGVQDKTLNIIENRAPKGVDFYSVNIYSRQVPAVISLSDSVELNVSGKINAQNMHLGLKNNSKFIGEISAKKIWLNMQDKSRANFTGNTGAAYIKIKDTASIIAPYWEVGSVQITSENGNYAELDAIQRISGEIKNTVRLTYYNDPIRALKIDKNATVINKNLK